MVCTNGGGAEKNNLATLHCERRMQGVSFGGRVCHIILKGSQVSAPLPPPLSRCTAANTPIRAFFRVYLPPFSEYVLYFLLPFFLSRLPGGSNCPSFAPAY